MIEIINNNTLTKKKTTSGHIASRFLLDCSLVRSPFLRRIICIIIAKTMKTITIIKKSIRKEGLGLKVMTADSNMIATSSHITTSRFFLDRSLVRLPFIGRIGIRAKMMETIQQPLPIIIRSIE
jgi:hypothetical protein